MFRWLRELLYKIGFTTSWQDDLSFLTNVLIIVFIICCFVRWFREGKRRRKENDVL